MGALWAVWAVLTVAALVDVTRGPHRTRPLPVRRRDDETTRRSR